MMNKLLALFCMAFSACKDSVRNRPCNDFRTGHFVCYFQSDTGRVRVDIERTENRQIEIERQSGDTTWHDLRWVDSCRYKLYFERSTMKMREEIRKLRVTKPFTVEIIGTGSDYYVFRGWREGIDFTLEDTAWLPPGSSGGK